MSTRAPRLALLGSALQMQQVDASTSSLDMHVDVALAALEDSGIEIAEVDGLVTFGSFTAPHSYQVLTLADRLGLRGLAYAECVQVGGAAAIAAVNRLQALIDGGVCKTALVVAADNQRSGIATAGALTAMFANRHPVYEQPYGVTTAALYALRATRYLHDHGLSPSVLAHATVAAKRRGVESGRLSDDALLSVEDVEGSRPITTPLRLLHCCKIVDGAAAVVASAPGRAADEVRVRGCGEYYRSGYYVHGAASNLVGAGAAAKAAFSQAGLSVEDIKLAYIYDAFASSIAPPIEEIGFAAPGRAYDAFAEDAFGPGGEVLINPHGGLLALGNPGYPAGLMHIAAAVEDAKRGTVPAGNGLVLVHGSGGVMSAQAVTILERS